jgi:hypothetical protein
MFIINNNDEILIKKVKDFINNNSQLTKIFTHHKVKYPIYDMLKNILIIYIIKILNYLFLKSKKQIRIHTIPYKLAKDKVNQ